MRITIKEVLLLLYTAYVLDEKNRNRNFTLVLMLISTSTRIGELIKIKEEDIKLENNLVYADGKSGNRVRFLTPGLIESLEEFLKDPRRIDALKGSKEKYLFYSDKGGPLSTSEANKLLKQLARFAGINQDITTYWLRRTFATILASSGLSTREIQEIFDHDRIQNTEAYILERKKQNLAKIVNQSSVIKMLEGVIRKQLKVL